LKRPHPGKLENQPSLVQEIGSGRAPPGLQRRDGRLHHLPGDAGSHNTGGAPSQQLSTIMPQRMHLNWACSSLTGPPQIGQA